MSVYKAAGPFIQGVSAQPSAVPVYEGQTAAIQVSITLAAHPNLTLGMYEKDFCYRPQRSCGKVMFSQVSVILFTGQRVYPSLHWGRPPGQTLLGRHPLGRHPPRQTPPG